MFHKIKKNQFLFSVLKDVESAHNRFLKALQNRVTCSELQKMELKDVELQPKQTDETWSTLVISLTTIALVFVLLSVIFVVALIATFCCLKKTDQDYEMGNIEGGEIPQQQQVDQQDEGSWD
jgi:hypothetical protein